MICRRTWTLLFLIFFAWAGECAIPAPYPSPYSIIYGFSKPVIADKNVLFEDYFGNVLFCISRKTGRKLWELHGKKEQLTPWAIPDGRLLIFKIKSIPRSQIFECDANSGKMHLVFEQNAYLKPIGVLSTNNLLVWSLNNSNSVLLALDKSKYTVRWNTSNYVETVAINRDKSFVIQANRHSIGYWTEDCWTEYLSGVIDWRSDRLSEIRLSCLDGHGNPLWVKSLPSDIAYGGILQGQNVLLMAGYSERQGFVSFQCYRQEDGAIIRSLDFGASDSKRNDWFTEVSFGSDGGNTLALLHYFDIDNIWNATNNSIYSIEIPSLKLRPLFEAQYAEKVSVYHHILLVVNGSGAFAYSLPDGKQLWTIGSPNYHYLRVTDGVFDGFIYFSAFDYSQQTDGVYEAEVLTGKLRKLISRSVALPRRDGFSR